MKNNKILNMLENTQNMNYCLYGNANDKFQFEQYVRSSENENIIIIYKLHNVKKNALILSGENEMFFKYVKDSLVEIDEEEFDDQIGDYAGIVKAPVMIKSLMDYMEDNEDSFELEEDSNLTYQIKNSEQILQLTSNPRTSLKSLTIKFTADNNYFILEEMSDLEFDKSTDSFKSFTKNDNITVD